MNCIACDSECVASANYCHICGINLRLPVVSCAACDVQEGNSRCDFCQKVVDYFHHGYPYDAIVGLQRRDGFAISVRTFKRKLVELGLSRKRTEYYWWRGYNPIDTTGDSGSWHTGRLSHYLARATFKAWSTRSSTFSSKDCKRGWPGRSRVKKISSLNQAQIYVTWSQFLLAHWRLVNIL